MTEITKNPAEGFLQTHETFNDSEPRSLQCIFLQLTFVGIGTKLQALLNRSLSKQAESYIVVRVITLQSSVNRKKGGFNICQNILFHFKNYFDSLGISIYY